MYRICFIIFPRRLWKSEWSNTPALAEAWPLQLEFVYHQKQLVAVCLLFRMPIQITVGDQSPSPKTAQTCKRPNTTGTSGFRNFKMEMQLCLPMLSYKMPHIIMVTQDHGGNLSWHWTLTPTSQWDTASGAAHLLWAATDCLNLCA